jgi:hypothetical protein
VPVLVLLLFKPRPSDEPFSEDFRGDDPARGLEGAASSSSPSPKPPPMLLPPAVVLVLSEDLREEGLGEAEGL